MNVESLLTAKKNPKIPEISPGDTVKVSARIVEGGKERIQLFQGVVIRIKRNGNASTFTVRQVFQGIGVERTFPFNSPRVEKVEIVQGGKVRRAKLYYLRGLSGKAARKKVKKVEVAGRRTVVELAPAEEMEQAPEEALAVMEEPKAETAVAPAAMEKAPEAEAAPEQPSEEAK